VTNQTSEEKRLRHTSFAIHATRGVIRDQKTRRSVMLVLLLVALVQIIVGVTILQGRLDPHVRPGLFIFFWLICAWLTITAVLLALFDLLIVRSEERKARRELQQEIERASAGESLKP
jgi:undecaprenyl pyrophosphate phosphatase UppP